MVPHPAMRLRLGSGLVAVVLIGGCNRVKLVEGTRTCPQDQVIVGSSGRGGALVDAVTLTCAPQTNCPMGQVATQQRLRSGDGLDAFGVGCSAIGLAY